MDTSTLPATSESTRKLIARAESLLRISLTTIGTRHAYHADETRKWYWVTVQDMHDAVTMARGMDETELRDLYSHWCGNCANREVSALTVARHLT